jgi:hypothetical protein
MDSNSDPTVVQPVASRYTGSYLSLYSYVIKMDKSKRLMNTPEIRHKNNYDYQSLKVRTWNVETRKRFAHW